METEQFSTEIKEDFLEFNENEGTTYPIIWDTLEKKMKTHPGGVDGRK